MITVAIVDDQRAIREGLQSMINLSSGFSCPAIYANGRQALQGIPKVRPHVILLDIEMPGLNGIECARKLRQIQPHISIIMLSVHDDVDRIQAAFQAGAHGFLTKDTFPSKILQAIADVHGGGAPMNPVIARRLVQSLEKPDQLGTRLSDREQEILQKAGNGLSNQDTARDLHISPNTVRFHLKNIYRKLEVHSKVEAIQKAMREGLL